MRRTFTRVESDKASAPPWMVTFADMMGLMVGFFILIVSFSSIEKHKITEAVKSVQGALGVNP